MPRAKRRCAKPECKRYQPCPTHPRGWAASTTEPLPTDWKSKVKAVKRRSEGRCEHKMLGVRCIRPGGSVDHIVNRAEWPKGQPGQHDLSNLQHLCQAHHDIKTDQEKKRGVERARRR